MTDQMWSFYTYYYYYYYLLREGPLIRALFTIRITKSAPINGPSLNNAIIYESMVIPIIPRLVMYKNVTSGPSYF